MDKELLNKIRKEIYNKVVEVLEKYEEQYRNRVLFELKEQLSRSLDKYAYDNYLN